MRLHHLAAASSLLALTGCASARGSIAYEAADPFGSFSGSVTGRSCVADVVAPGATPSGVYLARARGIRNAITFHPPGDDVYVKPDDRGWVWDLKRDQCSVFEARQWYGPGGELHVVVRLDCTPTPPAQWGPVKPTHVYGTVESDSCELQ
jgi:hypothetical protein